MPAPAPAWQQPPPQWGVPPQAPAPYGVAPPYGGAPYGGAPYGAGYGGPPEPPKRSNTAIIAIIIAAVVVAAVVIALILVPGRSGGGTSSTTAPPPPPRPTTTVTIDAPSPVATDAPSPAQSETIGAVPYQPGDKVAVNDALPGLCFDEKTTIDDGRNHFWVIDCTSPHDAEFFFKEMMSPGAYPADSDWTDLAKAYCLPAFEEYVGVAYVDSALYFTYIYPGEQGWNSGDRMLVCYAVDHNGDRTSSVKDSKE